MQLDRVSSLSACSVSPRLFCPPLTLPRSRPVSEHCMLPQRAAMQYGAVRRLALVRCPRKGFGVARAFEQGNGSNNAPRDPSLDEFVEVKVDSVRVHGGASIVYLRVQDPHGFVLAVHIGEHESSALLKEINKQRTPRPITHDVTKNLLSSINYRVTKVRIVDIVANTYYARIHLARFNAQGVVDSDEIDVDARPSDAINLAVRFGAPMYISKRIAEQATSHPSEALGSTAAESHADIVKSVRETLASFEDPTIMYQLQKELAIQEQRFEDAHVFQQNIYYEMTHNRALRLVVAMEAALADARYEEAARLRDEYKRLSVAVISSTDKTTA